MDCSSPTTTKDVFEIRSGDDPLDPARTYAIATNSMLADGGHNYATFREGKELAEHGAQFEMIAEWIRQQKKVNVPTDVRISVRRQKP